MASDHNNQSELESFYLAASYVVDDGGVRFTIRFGDDNEELQHLLSSRGAGTWAFLTAYNPRSQPLPAEQNEARQLELTKLLDQQNYRYLRGRGEGDDWQEPSLFILDIDRGSAVAIGKQFEQNAILWARRGNAPELVWCVE